LAQLGYGVEEDDDLGFCLDFCDFLEQFQDDFVFVAGTCVEVAHSQQPFVLVLGIELNQIMADQIILHKLAKLVLAARGRSNQELNPRVLTFAVEVFMAGLASSLSISLNSPRVSSLTLSH
jgi:hypothetical protein